MKAQILRDLVGGAAGPDADPDAGAEEPEDGRRVRRDRNREAVIDALLELYADGELDPSAAQIAERAGSSPRSVFRYFDDVDDLCRAAITRQLARVGHLAEPVVSPDAPVESRIAALLASRAGLYDTIGNAGVVARIRAPFQPVIAGMLAQTRAALRAQIEALFAPELAAIPRSRRAQVAASIDVLCSFESYRLLRVDQGLSRQKATATLDHALSVLLRSEA